MLRRLNSKNKKGQRPTIFLPKNRKGISTIIVTVLLIGLTLVAIAIVWAVVNNLLKGKMSNTEACFGNFGKVTLNSQYTCYEPLKFHFSLSIGDIDVEKVTVSVSSAGTTKSFEISKTGGQIPNLGNYPNPDFGEDLIKLPDKNSGSTYVTNFFSTIPDSVKIAPFINEQQCEISDTLAEIGTC